MAITEPFFALILPQDFYLYTEKSVYPYRRAYCVVIMRFSLNYKHGFMDLAKVFLAPFRVLHV